jgi:phosphoribosylanthranilate isomerase
MLAGGLTPDNVGRAIQLTGARQVDVASGVESAPGVKDAAKIAAFVAAAQGVKAGVPILR